MTPAPREVTEEETIAEAGLDEIIGKCGEESGSRGRGGRRSDRLRDYRLTQASIAPATGATVRSVRNWQETSAIRPRNDERLRELREIVLVLRETLTPRGVGQWLNARNRLLGGRKPIEMLAEGKAKAVRDAANAYVEGAYV